MNRLFEITHILLNKKQVTASELAEHFGVSQRTIYRDIDSLDLAGIPIYTEKGKGGGIGILPVLYWDDWVNGFILSFGEYAEVLEPEHVKNIIKQKAQKISEKY